MPTVMNTIMNSVMNTVMSICPVTNSVLELVINQESHILTISGLVEYILGDIRSEDYLIQRPKLSNTKQTQLL